MSQPKDQDQSMEEILQSIKRIIAEEGTPTSGSDVLELTDMLGDDGDTAAGDAEPAMATMSIDEIMAAPLSSGPTAFEEPAQTPAEIADALFADAPAFVPEPEPEPVAPEPVVAPTPAPTPVVAAPAPAPATDDDSALVSPSTLQSAQNALSALKNIPEASLPPLTPSGIGFRSGTTIEDLVLESLKPMLKDWLDTHLTAMVERLVEKEVRKLSQR